MPDDIRGLMGCARPQAAYWVALQKSVRHAAHTRQHSSLHVLLNCRYATVYSALTLAEQKCPD